MIDNAHKDFKKCKKFDKNFSIKVYMTKVDNYEMVMKSLKKDKGTKGTSTHRQSEQLEDSDYDADEPISTDETKAETDAKKRKEKKEFEVLVPERKVNKE